MNDAYRFTNNWFSSVAKSTWDLLIPQIKPQRLLEVGSFEGASACYLVDHLASAAPIELHCVDTWAGGVEHQADGQARADMESVEARFRHNVAAAVGRAAHPVDLKVHKGYSDAVLARLLAEGRRGHFDFVYIDGSHQAPDVLADAVLGFRLLRVGGLMAFDDYLWSEDLPYGKDPLRCPKPAVDAFVNLNFRKLRVVQLPANYQLYVQKTSD